MKNLIFILLVVGGSQVIFAQQDPMFTKYMFNSIVFNPAYAGSQGYWDINATYRKQWLSFDGAPTTFLGAAEGQIGTNVGLGFTLFNDAIGVDNRTDFSANYAYRFKTMQGKLALGIKAGAAIFRTDFSNLTFDPGDGVYMRNYNTVNPYAGFGIFYNEEKFFFGISSPTLISIDANQNDSIPKFLSPHFYINVGTKLAAGDKIELRPSLFFSFQKAAPFQAHINLTALFEQRFAVGLSYRTGDALNINTAWFINSNLRIGLAYDFTLSRLRTFNDGSFEVMIGYSLGKQIKKIQNVRNL